MMKWWGWGDYAVTFPMHEKPLLWPWIKERLGMKGDNDQRPPVQRSNVVLSTPKLHQEFCLGLKNFLKPDQYTTDDDERLHHAYGKSYPNLFEARSGHIRQAPDMVVKPRNHAEVEVIVKLAHLYDICLIPFGGGTNIVGGVDPDQSEERMIITMSMRLMNRVLSIDPYSQIAVIEAGASGPELEKQLAAQGWSLGHFPDSFEYSTVGGWVATRSAGMQSDAYGKIEDMVVALKMVTPSGTIQTRTVPAASSGPDLNRMICGSEGVLGIITETTMRVHPVPAEKDYRGFLFKSFSDGVEASRECVMSGFSPSMIRIQDSYETELAFKMKAPKKGLTGLIHKAIKLYLSKTGYTAPCIMIIGFEGSKDKVKTVRERTLGILKKYDAFPLGTSVGSTWSKDKYNMPYLRDYVMDHGVMCDVSETSASWANIMPLHRATIEAVNKRFKEVQNGYGYIGCHLSHSYETGACLYFTYAAKQIEGKEIEQYYGYKKLVTDTFMANGASLTHHHAVGYEHMPWLEEELSETGVNSLRALKRELDPKGILNPRKLIPAKNESLADEKAWWQKAPEYKANPPIESSLYTPPSLRTEESQI